MKSLILMGVLTLCAPAMFSQATPAVHKGCSEPKTDKDIGHCDLSKSAISIPFVEDDFGGIYVAVSFGDRSFTKTAMDTGSSTNSVPDVPVTEELKGAATIEVATANGSVKEIINAVPVCVFVSEKLSICQLSVTSFATQAPALLGNSFLRVFGKMIVNRKDKVITIQDVAKDEKVFLLLDGKLYTADGL